MGGKPAARVDDMTEHGTPLGPGPGSDNVLIGGKKAWRAEKKEEEADDAVFDALGHLKDYFELAADARDAFQATPPPKNAEEAAEQAEDRQVDDFKFAKSLTERIAEIVKAVFPADPDEHACTTPEHGPGKVEEGSENVFINNLPACRKGDKVKEEPGGEDEIVEGCDSVLIGDENKVLELMEKIGGLVDLMDNAKQLFDPPPPEGGAAKGGAPAPAPDHPAVAAFKKAALEGQAVIVKGPAFDGIE
jgi:uncharacterized Zn-binding protein involved in type VI secretion